MVIAMYGDTPTWGNGAVRRWVALLDRAEALMREADPDTAFAQRPASQAIASLFLYEHQMTGLARRRAREYVWRRDRPDKPLPDMAVRQVWEHCLCRNCLVERVLGRPSTVPPALQAA